MNAEPNRPEVAPGTIGVIVSAAVLGALVLRAAAAVGDPRLASGRLTGAQLVLIAALAVLPLAGERPRWGRVVAVAGPLAALALLAPAGVVRRVAEELLGVAPAGAPWLLQTLVAWGALLVGVAWELGRLAWRELTGPRGSIGRTVVLYAAATAVLAVWSHQIQSLTGDEPHYLLAARSLAIDGDADLADDYAARRYAVFFPSDLPRRTAGVSLELDPHDVPGRDGARRPVHQLGLSLLLLPGYLIGQTAGAVAVAWLLGALLAWQILRLADAAGTERRAAASLLLLSPILVYASSLHAEPAAALALTCLAVSTLRPARGLGESLLGALLAALAVWLHLKLLPVLLVLTVAAGCRARRPAGWLPLLGAVAGALGQLALFAVWFGSWRPDAPQLAGAGKFPGPFSGSLLVGLPGLLVDQQDGLLWTWPTGLLALPGLLLGWREKRLRPLLVAVAVHFALIASYRIWNAGFAPAGRQLLPILPLLVPFVGLGWKHGPARPLVVWNVAVVTLLAWLPRLRYPLVGADGVGRQPLLGQLGGWADVVWPAVTASPLALLAGWVYLGVLASWAWRGARAGRSEA